MPYERVNGVCEPLEPRSDVEAGGLSQSGHISCLEEGKPAKHSTSLDMLSEELDRQTKETQMLQEEVEQATRLTLERMGHAFSNTRMPINAKHTTSGTSFGSSKYGISKQQPFLQPTTNNVDVNTVRCLNFPGKDILKRAVEKYSQQVSDLQQQLREIYERHEQQKFNFHESIIQLQTKLHESQTEKDALQDLRMTESEKKDELMRQLQDALLELDSQKQTGEQKLIEAEERAEAFSRSSETMEQMLQDMFTRLSSYEKHRGKSNYFCCDGNFSPSKFPLGLAVEKTLQDLENENCGLQEKLELVERRLKDLEKEGQERTKYLLKEQNKNMEQLTTGHNQEMAMLTEKLRGSQDEAASLQLQVEILQEQIESQSSLHQSQMTNLEPTLLRSELLEKLQRHEAKVVALEEVLDQAQFQADQSQRERDLLQQQAEELDVQLCQLTMSANTDQQETQNKLEQLCGEIQHLQQDKNEAMQLHKQSSREAERLQFVLDGREKEMQFQQQEAQPRVQTLWAEMEVLQMKMKEWENSIELLRKPLETLQNYRSSLAIQLENVRLDNQHLKSALQEAEVRLSAVENENIQQQAVLSERTSSLHQLMTEKQQMTAELEQQCVRLNELKEEHKALREQYSRKAEELQEQNSKLKAQLNNTQSSLDKAKSALGALEGADGHGLKVALGMQKQITAKREQIDFLQSRVQMLEETIEKLALEKRYRVMGSKHHMQELQFAKESRRRLETELDTLRTNEKLLKSKADRLDTALHKMSDSFAECQEFIQKQEQEIMRIKLQHALEVKELQGQNLRTIGNIHKSLNHSTVPEQLPTFHINSTNHMELNTGSQRSSPALELRGLVKELLGVFDEGQGSHCSLTTRTISKESQRTRNEQGPLRSPDLDKRETNSSFSANNEEQRMKTGRSCYRSSSCVAALGRRSPVHSLLTSDLPTDLHDNLKAESPTNTIQMSSSFQKQQDKCPKTGQTCKELQSKLNSLQNQVEDLQIKNQEMTSMIKTQEKRMRKVKDTL